MLRATIRELRPAITLLAAFTLITGVLYPGVITAVARGVFPEKASGSLITRDGTVAGSDLIAQGFTSARYFWPRPSACAYNAASSSGSNLAMSNPALLDAVRQRLEEVRASDPLNTAPVPADLVLASGSGLDPHISIEAALWQVSRVARVRRISEDAVRDALAKATDERSFGVLGEPMVNVLRLNLLLDAGR